MKKLINIKRSVDTRKLIISSVLISIMIITAMLLAACGNKSNNENGDIMKRNTENPTATVETSKGAFKFELFLKQAPITANNFIELAKKGFYGGLTFHRYEPGFVIQGGDPNGDGTGGSEKTIPLEINKELRHNKGAVAMARSQDPDSASSQFYVTLENANFLDDNYAVFGRVFEGMDNVLKLRAGDKIDKITIEEK